MKEEMEYEAPALGDKAEAIRRKYCLENDRVFESQDDDYTFWEEKESLGEQYLCFKASELDSMHYKGNLYFIKRFK